MFLRHDEQKKIPSFEELQKKLLALRTQLDQALDVLGLDRAQLDQYRHDPSLFSSVDWIVIERELQEFRSTLDLICFGQSEDDLKNRREEMRKRGQWMDSK